MKVNSELKKVTKLSNIWNKVIQWNGIYLAGVMWHEKAWKVVNTPEFDLIKDGNDKTHVIAEFKYQTELWNYVTVNN